MLPGQNEQGCPPGPTPTLFPVSDMTPTPYQPPPPGCTSDDQARCIPENASDEDVVAFVVACEGVNHEEQAIGIAHVIRNRVNSAHFPGTAADVVRQSGFQCYSEGARSDSPTPNSDSENIRELASALVAGDPLPPPLGDDPRVAYEALYFYGFGPYGENDERPIDEQLLQQLCNAGVSSDCNQLRQTYLTHTDIGEDAPFLTVFFSDDPGFTGNLP